MKKNMRYLFTTWLLVLGMVLASWGSDLDLSNAEKSELLLQSQPDIGIWIWTDKYVYQPGQSLTLRGMVRAHGNVDPYTLVVYRQNNQTGVKTYLPINSSQASDIWRRTSDQGFYFTRVYEATKGVILGPGGSLGPSWTVPNELGMHPFVLEVRDYTGTRVVKAAYFKFGIVSGFEDLTGNVDAD